MRRFAILFLLAAATTTVIAASPAPGCDLLKHLLHRCKSCYHCGGHKCHLKKCHRPKCHCTSHHSGHGHYGYHGGHNGGHHGGYYAPKRHYHKRYYGGPSYVEPSAPVYEEIIPPGRDF